MGLLSTLTTNFKEGVQGVKEAVTGAVQKTGGLFAQLNTMTANKPPVVDPSAPRAVEDKKFHDEAVAGAKALPGKLKTAGDFVASIPRAVPRTIISFGLDPVNELTEKMTGIDNPKPEYKPTGLFQKLAFGDEPVKAASTRIEENQKTGQDLLEKTGIPKKNAEALSVGFVGPFMAALTGLDLTPMGGGAKTAEKIAASKSPELIEQLLKPMFKEAFPEEIAALSKQLVEVTDKRQVNEIILKKLAEKKPQEVGGVLTEALGKNAPNLASGEAKAAEMELALGGVGKPPIEPPMTAEGGGVIPPSEPGSSLEKLAKTLEAGQEEIKQANKIPVADRIKKVATDFYDRFHPIAAFEGDIEKTLERKLTAEESAYVGARLYAGVGGKIEQRLGVLGDVLDDHRDLVKNGDLSNFLFAQRTLERGERGFLNPGGLTVDDAKNALKEMEEQLGPETYNKIKGAAARVYQYGDDLLQYMKDGGIISEGSYKAIKEKNQMYVPFDVVSHMIEQESGSFIPSGSRAFSVAEQNLVQNLKGTTLNVDDPLNAMVRKTIEAVDVVERNKVAQRIGDLSTALGKDNSFVIQLGKEGTETIPRNYEKISFFKNGIKEEFAIPKDVVASLKRLNDKEVDMVTRGASFWAKALRSGATSANLAFIIPNALRDFETATLVAKHGFNPMDWGKGFWEGAKATLADYGVKVDDSVYQEYLKSAGKIGGYYSTYLNDVPRTVKELTRPTWQKLLKLLNPLHLIGESGQLIERAPRLGVFMKALSKGETPEAAAMVAREATVDFSKSGNTMRIINMWVPFVNARLQGEINIGKSLLGAIKNPKRAAELAAKIGGMAIIPFVGTYYNNITRFPNVWKDIADWEKANNIIFIYGDKKDETGEYTQVIKIPKGDWNFFIDPIQDVLEWMYEKKPDLLTSLIKTNVANLLPFSISTKGGALEMVESAAGTLTPPPIKALLEGASNHSFYKGQQLVPDSLKNNSPRYQYRPYSPKVAQVIGDFFNISPIKIENGIGDMFGGVGKQVLGMGGTVEDPKFTLPFKKVSDRFAGAQSGGDVAADFEEIGDYKTKQADRQFLEKQAAQKTLTALLSASSAEEATRILADVKENKGVMEKMKKLMEDKVNETTSIDNAIQNLSPVERAQYIVDKLKTFHSAGEAAPFLLRLKKNKLLTDDTKTAMKKIYGEQAAAVATK